MLSLGFDTDARLDSRERCEVIDPEPDVERRNYYRITPLGMRVARAEARRLDALTRAARIGGLLEKGSK